MRINPVLDITVYRVPLEMREVLNNENDVALEIGFGDGDFLIQMARERPDLNYLGIEIKYGRFKKAVSLALSHGVSNVKLLHMDATVALDEVFNPETFVKVYINFPDPWPKDRHQKHRIINSSFLDRLSRIMKPEGSLEIASDHRDYMEHVLNVFSEHGKFKNSRGIRGYSNALTDRPSTKYEIEYRMEGREIFYLSYTKENNS